MIEQGDIPKPRHDGRMVAIYAAGILSFAVVALTIAVVLGAQHDHQMVPLGTPVTDEGHTHVTAFAPFTNQHFPPSSGPHYADLLKPGFYSTPVPEGSYVHNLEQGYIVVLFKRTANGGTLGTQLQDLPDIFPVGKNGGAKLIVAPYDGMDTPVMALAWDRELPMNVVDRAVLLRFYQEYVDHGPGDVP